jgi:hypothetical protein
MAGLGGGSLVKFCYRHFPQARIVGRHVELVAQGDHLGADFKHRDARLRKMAVAELDQRAAAQAGHDDVARPRREQGEAHHGARVVEHQGVGTREQHLALDIAGHELQRAAVALGAHPGRGAGWLWSWIGFGRHGVSIAMGRRAMGRRAMRRQATAVARRPRLVCRH